MAAACPAAPTLAFLFQIGTVYPSHLFGPAIGLYGYCNIVQIALSNRYNLRHSALPASGVALK
jgi:hypothetical protein